MKNRCILLGLSLLFCSSCQPDKDKICTEIFVSYFVSVRDSSDQPVLLDSYSAVKTKTNEDLTIQTDSMNKADGNYTLLTDAEKNRIEEDGSEIKFTGFKNGSTLFEKRFVIGHDKCHIRLLSGNTKVIVNK
jgi:hypothetical protein